MSKNEMDKKAYPERPSKDNYAPNEFNKMTSDGNDFHPIDTIFVPH